YLNGAEVYRNNLPGGAVSFNTLATMVAPDENDYLTAPVSSTLLVSGHNVVAAEVHQANPASSDIGFDLALIAEGMARPATNPCPRLPAPDDQFNPAVASDGSGFLVVWTDQRSFGSGRGIYGARVSAAGEMLDPGGILICTVSNSQSSPAVAF